MRWEKRKEPQKYDLKFKRKFCWWPMTIGNHVHWLEFVKKVYIYKCVPVFKQGAYGRWWIRDELAWCFSHYEAYPEKEYIGY